MIVVYRRVASGREGLIQARIDETGLYIRDRVDSSIHARRLGP